MDTRTYPLVGYLVAVVLAGSVGCGGTDYPATGTGQAPGTDAVVNVEHVAADNHLVEIQLEHLMPPERVQSDLQTYCVWIIPEGKTAQLASRLEYDADDREGTATATTPYARFQVRVTGERSCDVQSPSEHVVLTRDVEDD